MRLSFPSLKNCTFAPDPTNFQILKVKQINNNVVAKIKYPSCTTFEGIKICLYVDYTCKELKELSNIDPHFSPISKSPFARFIPTIDGWKMALLLAKIIK